MHFGRPLSRTHLYIHIYIQSQTGMATIRVVRRFQIVRCGDLMFMSMCIYLGISI